MGGGGKSSDPVKIGYHYYMNIHFALGHGGIQDVLEFRAGDRTAWKGKLTGAGSLTIDKPSLFGGPDTEGGLRGVVDVMPGLPGQPVNGDLRAAVERATGNPHTPAYRGISTAYFKGSAHAEYTGTSDQLENDPGRSSSFLWSSMNPYFKSIMMRVKRCWQDWYTTKATIAINGVNHANPAHIIYECLTNSTWGLGYPIVDMDDASFRSAADQLHAEGLGLSMTWVQQTSIEEFISDINEHINASLIEDRVTGKWRVILIRDNYDAATLPVLNESNCKLENFQRKSLSDTVNEVTISFTRPEDGAEDTITVQDLANFANQGQINAQKTDYPGIGDRTLAYRIAMRDLQTMSKPVSKVTLFANRDAFDLYPGQAFKLEWATLGLAGVVYRIGTMDLGTLSEGLIQIEAVEDVFGLPDSSYAEPQPIGWVDTQRPPAPVEQEKLFEASYYELYTATSSADRLDWPSDVGFGVAMADSPSDDATSLKIYDNDTNQIVGGGEFTPKLVLTTGVDEKETTFTFDPDLNPDILMHFGDGGLAWVDTELVHLTGIDTVAGTVTAERGMIDTVPVRHLTGATVWFYQRSIAAGDPTERVDGEIANYKLLTTTSMGTLDPSQAPTVSYTFQNRQLRPYAPGNVKIEGEYFPVVQNATFDPTITWAHRDRTQQLADPIGFTTGNIGPETGTTYHLRIFDEDGVLAVDDATLTGTVFDWMTEVDDLGKSVLAPSGVYEYTGTVALENRRNSEINVKLKSQRDSLDSYQEHDITVERDGWGYRYGDYYGGH